MAGIQLHLEFQVQRHEIDYQPLIARIDTMTQSVEQLLQLSRGRHGVFLRSLLTGLAGAGCDCPMQDAMEEMVEQRIGSGLISKSTMTMCRYRGMPCYCNCCCAI
ncbi:MAG: hypothetical protein ACSLEN_03730 [Candidatus Malihini olakiniferum]